MNLEILGNNHDPGNFPNVINNPQAVYANDLYRKMKIVNRKVQQAIRQQAEYMKRVYDRHVKGPYFEPGQYVMMLVEPHDTKLAGRWSGPFYVKDKISDHLYVIELDKTEKRVKIVNVEKLKLYKPSIHTPILPPSMIFKPTTTTNFSKRIRQDSSGSESDYGLDSMMEMPRNTRGNSGMTLTKKAIGNKNPNPDRNSPELRVSREEVLPAKDSTLNRRNSLATEYLANSSPLIRNSPDLERAS